MPLVLLQTAVAALLTVSALIAPVAESAPATAPAPVEAVSSSEAAPAVAATLGSGEELQGGRSLVSSGGAFTFVMQEDGNAVVYDRSGRASWSTGTQGLGDRLVMQTDGNVVVYSSRATPVWSTGTDGEEGATLTVQDDGNLVVRRTDDSPAWASSTGGRIAAPAVLALQAGERLAPGRLLTSLNGPYEAVMQRDGNFVVTGPGGPVWSTRTSGSGNRLELQTDGNAVVYAPDGSAEWASGTSGHRFVEMTLGIDGDLTIFDGEFLLWSSRSQIRTDTFTGPGSLYAGEVLVSSNGRWRAPMQSDGNFVVYGPDGATWSTGTGRSTPQSTTPRLTMDELGTLNLRSSEAFWYAVTRFAGSTDQPRPPLRLVMQDDGNLVEHDMQGRAVWAIRGL